MAPPFVNKVLYPSQSTSEFSHFSTQSTPKYSSQGYLESSRSRLVPLQTLERSLYSTERYMSGSESSYDGRESAASGSGSVEPSSGYRCQWVECSQSFIDPETLYNHLCNDHIGRKSTNNLCLTCKWKDCGTSCAKRDHITSHLRVHTPLKPHVCEICKKSFKRPQDLKKHEKIHTEEHHAQHKHSKAITVVDPGYVSRVRKEPDARSDKDKLGSNIRAPTPRSDTHSSASPESSLPTPSPELPPAHHHIHRSPLRDDIFGHSGQIPAWEFRSDPHAVHVSAGSKRSHDHDYNVDDFFSDMKKRRVNPSYDPGMAERLNSLAYNNYAPFNPRSVSLDIHTPEELAAVNEFLVTLGRDVSSSMPNRAGHGQNHSVHTPDSSFSPESYFDPVGLSQLGLAGMPGLPNDDYASNSSIYAGGSPTSSNFTHRPTSNLYSGIPDNDSSAAHPSRRSSRYPHSQYDYPSQTNYHQSTPPLDPSSGSPHSTASTPLNATPPHISNMQSFGNMRRYPAVPTGYASQSSHHSLSQYGLHLNPSAESAADYNFVRSSHGPVPDVGIMMGEPIVGKGMRRSIVALKSIPSTESAGSSVGAPPEPVEPKLSSNTLHRGPPAILSSIESTSSKTLTPIPTSATPSSSLYPSLILTKGEKDDLTLPPLHSRFRSTSPVAHSTTPSREQSPCPQTTVLPSFKTVAEAGSVPRTPRRTLTGESDELAREVGKIELAGSTASSPALPNASLPRKGFFDVVEKRNIPLDDRRRHAELIKSLLVGINEDFKRRSGFAPKANAESDDKMDVDEVTAAGKTLISVSNKDVEMCSA